MTGYSEMCFLRLYLLLLLLAPPILEGKTAEGPPQWAMRMTDRILYTEYPGALVKFKCPAKGNPLPSVDWLKNGKPFISRECGLLARNGWTLTLYDLMDFDKGNYTCVISNPYGKIMWTFLLEIVSRVPIIPPLITNPPQNTSVSYGGNATLHCKIMPDAPTLIQWLKHYKVNGSYFDDKKKPYVRLLKSSGLNKDQQEMLHLTNASNDTVGWYTCVVVNVYGKSHYSAWVTVVQPTDNPATVEAENSTGNWSYFMIVGAGIFTTCALGSITYYNCRKGNKSRKVVVNMQLNSLYSRMADEPEKCYDAELEFPREQLKLLDQIGEGAFGRVFKGTVTGLAKRSENLTVAVKMLKDDATDRQLADFVEELKIMRIIGQHVNVINLLGCCTNNGELFIITEFACHGNMLDFLRSRRPQDTKWDNEHSISPVQKTLRYKDMVSLAYQTARGMEYIASKNIVHRDLAARNLLIADGTIVKIADFGMTRKINEQDYYRKTTDGRFPVRWMAPESLFDRKFSIKSDVWSFGVVVWEVFTLGVNPYPSVHNEHLYRLLCEDYRMEKPRSASIEIYKLMLYCWKFNPCDRPQFSEIVKELDTILSASQEYLRLLGEDKQDY